MDTLKANGIALEKLECGIANWNRAQAQNRMMQMVSQYQNKIELVLANNDDMALGASDAYEKLNYTESVLPVIFGIDGTDVGLLAVAEENFPERFTTIKRGRPRQWQGFPWRWCPGGGWKRLNLRMTGMSI